MWDSVVEFRFVHFKFHQGCLFSITSLRLTLRLHCKPAERWVRRVLAKQPLPTYPSRGRPQQVWDAGLEMLRKYKVWGNWEIVARNAVQWDALLLFFLHLWAV